MIRIKDVLNKFKKPQAHHSMSNFRGHGYYFDIADSNYCGTRGAYFGGYAKQVLKDKRGLMNGHLLNHLGDMKEAGFDWLFIRSPTLIIDNYNEVKQISQLTGLTFNDNQLTPRNIRLSWSEFINYCQQIFSMPVLIYSGANGFNVNANDPTKGIYTFNAQEMLPRTVDMIQLKRELGAMGVGLDAIGYVDQQNGYGYSKQVAKKAHDKMALLYEDIIDKGNPNYNELCQRYMQMHLVDPKRTTENFTEFRDRLTREAIPNLYPGSVNFWWRQGRIEWTPETLADYSMIAKQNGLYLIDYAPEVLW